MEELTGFRQQRETLFHFSWNCASAVLDKCLLCCLPPGMQATVCLLWAQNQVQHDREMSQALKCKGWSDLRTTQPRCSRGPWGETGSESTEGRSFKCNGFQWLNVSPFSLREMSPRCNEALSSAPLFKSFTCHMEEWSQTHPCCSSERNSVLYVHVLKAQNLCTLAPKNYANHPNTTMTMEKLNLNG